MPKIDSQDPVLHQMALDYFMSRSQDNSDFIPNKSEMNYAPYQGSHGSLLYNANWVKKTGRWIQVAHSAAYAGASPDVTGMENNSLPFFDDPAVGVKGTEFEHIEAVKVAEVYYAADMLDEFFRWAARAIMTGFDDSGALFDICVELMEQGIESPYDWATLQPRWWDA